MNSMSLRARAKNLSNKTNVDVNTIIRFYMYERFLERLSLSKYKDNFILKGGYYLSGLFGLENRSTMDIDAMVRNINFNEIKLKKIIQEILEINLNDGIEIKLVDIEKIREEDEYGGYRFTILCKLDNIREKFHFDVATGDPITPSEIRYTYKTIFDGRNINLWAYNIETVLSEKIEAIITRNVLGSRMKDYYDVYLISNLMFDKINMKYLKEALYQTFKKRDSLCYLRQYNVILDNIKNDEGMIIKWRAYQRKNSYSKNITLDSTIECITRLLSISRAMDLQTI